MRPPIKITTVAIASGRAAFEPVLGNSARGLMVGAGVVVGAAVVDGGVVVGGGAVVVGGTACGVAVTTALYAPRPSDDRAATRNS